MGPEPDLRKIIFKVQRLIATSDLKRPWLIYAFDHRYMNEIQPSKALERLMSNDLKMYVKDVYGKNPERVEDQSW